MAYYTVGFIKPWENTRQEGCQICLSENKIIHRINIGAYFVIYPNSNLGWSENTFLPCLQLLTRGLMVIFFTTIILQVLHLHEQQKEVRS